MKISELTAKNKPTLSFEVFPPKTGDAFENVSKVTEKIASLKPDFMSVTFGAGGSTGAYTLEVSKNIQDKFGVASLAHLTCVCSTKEDITGRLDSFKAAGIKNIMALRGDIPEYTALPRKDWAYSHADELIRAIKEYGDFCIGGACYPEVHPESPNRREDIARLKGKVEAGCDFLTTQMFFDNNILFNFLYHLREAGIKVPVIAGIMPVTNASQIRRIVGISGTQLPQRFKAILDKFGDNPPAMMQAGIAYATDQIIDLYANGINHIHVYTMNKPFVAEKITQNLSAILGRE